MKNHMNNDRKIRGWVSLVLGVVGLICSFGRVPWAGGLFGLSAGILGLDLGLTGGGKDD